VLGDSVQTMNSPAPSPTLKHSDSSPITIAEHRGVASLDHVARDWRRLYAEMSQRTGFHVYEAHRAYVPTVMAEPDHLRCVIISVDATARAICPLESRSVHILGRPVRVWRLTLPSHFPMGDVICPDEAVRRQLLPLLTHYLRRSAGGRRLLILGPLPQTSPLWAGLAELAPYDYCLSRTSHVYVFDSRQPFEVLLKRLARRYRADLRRRYRRLEALGNVRFATVANTAQLPAHLEAFFDLEARGWKGRPGVGKAIRLRKGQPDFFRDFVARMDGEDDHCEINELHADGRCIASLLCMRTGDEYAIMKTAYDEKYAHVAPGLLLLRHTLERCCADPRIARVNMLGDAAWLRPWHPDRMEMQQAYIALGRWSRWPLIAALEFRFGYGRRAARWLRGKMTPACKLIHRKETVGRRSGSGGLGQ